MDEIKKLAAELFNKDYVSFVESPSFEIVEKQSGGRGKCIFQAATNTLLIHMRENKFWALKNQRCAEAAFVHFDENNAGTLYLLEMKSTLRQSEFEKVLQQFDGMYLSSLAVLSLLNLPKPENVKAIVAFSQNKMDKPIDEKPLILNKQIIGQNQTIMQEISPELLYWQNEKVPLAYGQTADLIKQLRVCATNCGEKNCKCEKNADFTRII